MAPHSTSNSSTYVLLHYIRPTSYFTSISSSYALQTSLPHLPVPPLHATLDKYLRSLEPLVTKEELKKTTALVQQFGKSGGEGEALQSELLHRASIQENWLTEWWEQVAYLSDPTPNALFVNMVTGFGSFQDFDRPVSQARRAAETVRYTCEYLERLHREQVPPEMMGGQVLCMNMFRRLFSTCRIPEKPADRFKRVDPATVRHVVVFCEGRVFVLPVYDAENELLTIGDLEVQLLHILRHSAYLNSLPTTKREDDDLPQFVGALTSMRRDKWAEARQGLVEFDPLNERSLDKIETSLFTLCLESTTPDTPSELARQCAAANAGNRWFDKSFQYLVFTNGMVGANMEHANVDATVLQSMFRWLGERYLNRNGGYETFVESRHHSLVFLPPPELLRWRLPQEIVTSTIPAALSNFDRDGSTLRILVVRNKSFGKTNLRAVNLFPDTFVQMGIQLAGIRLFGRVVPTYESAHTRMFVEGRTETIRTVTSEVLAWLQVQDKSTDVDEIEVVEKLKHAMTRHKELSLEALAGNGIDRHLVGLQIAAMHKTGSPPALFTDSSYAKSGGGGNFVLSTSNVSGYPWLWGGFVPMIPHGIGICYGCENDFLSFMVTSFDPSNRDKQFPDPRLPRVTAQQFQLALFQAFDDIYGLMKRSHESAKPVCRI
ncbi:Choline/Carnitine O-acyltransferase [Phytophthora megakarya]|uniref:Choline/Carnitine O-acyltransferase n=1 Tax=Phytophthora megakarya TaxID=4795 RepID=A0A225WPE6_9STRA|nr:Choline/Carnitine O-acyltransferase [Phytophthora megakarya]